MFATETLIAIFKRPLTPIALALAFSLPAHTWAQESIMNERPSDILSEEEDKWKEAKIKFPPPPQDSDLVALDSEAIGGGYEYFIDPTSLSLGSDDVLRYSVVLQSNSGVRNIFYEGIRCATMEVKTYGYATQSGQFKPVADSPWKYLYSRGPFAYRVYLAQNYVCDSNGWPIDEKQVRKKIAQHNLSGIQVRPKPYNISN